jgi:hypothetical protein
MPDNLQILLDQGNISPTARGDRIDTVALIVTNTLTAGRAAHEVANAPAASLGSATPLASDILSAGDLGSPSATPRLADATPLALTAGRCTPGIANAE